MSCSARWFALALVASSVAIPLNAEVVGDFKIIATPVVWEDKVYFGMGQDPEHGEGVGNFWAIDATQDGDVTGKGVVWHRGGTDFHRTISTVAIHDGIVYASDLSGFLYAMDAATGQLHWKHDMLAAVWGSPFVADGRVYLASAFVDGRAYLRPCVVNYRTTDDDVRALVEIAREVGTRIAR